MARRPLVLIAASYLTGFLSSYVPSVCALFTTSSTSRRYLNEAGAGRCFKLGTHNDNLSRRRLPNHCGIISRMTSEASSTTEEALNLTPELEKLTNAFATLADEKTRYKQLLFMANKLPPFPRSSIKPENKVPGCLSTVYVDCVTEANEDGTTIINFQGDSDGQLTKGLVAFLVRGLSGCTAEEINNVNPSFIHKAKISQSLTPGRNNGFLNMLATMKQKAKEAASVQNDNSASTAPVITDFVEIEGKPMYNAIMSTLISLLKPSKIVLNDDSDQHSGHAGARGYSGESHFSLHVVADAFEGLPLLKRHQLIYMLLGDVMSQIHALKIEARAPSEVQ